MATRTKSRQAAARKGGRMSAASRRGKAAMRTSKSAVRSARSYIRKNPKKVAAVAAGLVAAGAYAARRRTQKARR